MTPQQLQQVLERLRVVEQRMVGASLLLQDIRNRLDEVSQVGEQLELDLGGENEC